MTSFRHDAVINLSSILLQKVILSQVWESCQAVHASRWLKHGILSFSFMHVHVGDLGFHTWTIQHGLRCGNKVLISALLCFLTKADRCYHVHSTVLHISSRLNLQDTVDTFILDFLVMALDSVASFKARLVELNLPQTHMDAFEARRVSTFANFAFIAPYQPSSSDEAPFVQALKDVLGVEPGDFLPTYRRLFYESHTMAVQDRSLGRSWMWGTDRNLVC